MDPRVVVIRAGEVVDAFFVRAERFDVLIDTLSTPEECRHALALLNVRDTHRQLVVVNSHMDWDHFWGNDAVAGRAPILAHETALLRFREASVPETLREKIQQNPKFRTVDLTAPTLAFSDQMTLYGGDLTVQILHTPGHTPDHTTVWIPELRVCIAVDAVEHPIPEVWSENPADLRALIGSLHRIRQLGATFVLPAHGQTCSPTLVDQNLNYFEELSGRTRTLNAKQLTGLLSNIPAGLGLSDFMGLAVEGPTELEDFYRRCHEKNLRATVRSHLELL